MHREARLAHGSAFSIIALVLSPTAAVQWLIESKKSDLVASVVVSAPVGGQIATPGSFDSELACQWCPVLGWGRIRIAASRRRSSPCDRSAAIQRSTNGDSCLATNAEEQR